MELVDSRRLTGTNLLVPGPAAVADVALAPGEADEAISRWRVAVSELGAALGWSIVPVVRVWHDGRGASLAFAAPIDALYAATDLNEWAIARVAGGGETLAAARDRIAAAIASEQRPRAMALVAAARARGLPWLLDEDGVTVGLGVAGRTWPTLEAPDPADVPWSELGTIPLVAVTGTNGKTTSVRLIARMLAASGRRTGNTSTDGIVVSGETVEDGDCTGPGAARRLLRRTDVEAAVLETARGGLLRRGLVLDAVDVALVTNVSDDHLGEWGIQTIEELAAVKCLVASIADRRVVLGADSAPLVRRRGSFAAPEVWFALDGDHPLLREHLARGGEAWWASPHGEIVRGVGSRRETVSDVSAIPLVFDGIARHNVANVLGACAVARGLGIPDEIVRTTLAEFGRTPADNLGRNEQYDVGGVTVLLDFAHNLDGLAREAPIVAALRARAPAGARLLVSFGMAGDRSDDMLARLAGEIATMGPDRVIVREQPHYMRGRVPGEVPRILHRAFVARGIAEDAIDHADDEATAVRMGLAAARPGDVLVVFAHTERSDAVLPLG